MSLEKEKETAKLQWKEPFSLPHLGARKLFRVGDVEERKEVMLKMVTGAFPC